MQTSVRGVEVGDRCATLFGAGVDYMRVTVSSETSRGLLRGVYGDLAIGAGLAGHKPAQWLWKGYRGIQQGSYSFGERDDGAILQATGSAASLITRYELPKDANIPRLDLQTTFVFDFDNELFWKETINAVMAWQAANPAPKHPLVGDSGYIGKGYTAYIGRRTSSAFGRTYDKGREGASEYALGTWRHEVEYHNELAKRTWWRLWEAGPTPGTVAAMVRGWYFSRGAPVPYGGEVIGPEKIPAQGKTDAQRQIAWLRRNVAPTVARLIADGYEVEAMQAIMSAYTTHAGD